MVWPVLGSSDTIETLPVGIRDFATSRAICLS